MLAAYDTWLHTKVFPTSKYRRVKELVGDGHEKILTKICAGDAIPKKSRKASRGKKKHFTNGWFMIAHPCGRIVSVEQQVEPENNDVVTRAMEKVYGCFPNLDCFVLDRNCKYAPNNKWRFPRIKTWAIDKFHAKRGHGPKCSCSPCNHRAIHRRLVGINTSVCEQVFSWLRNYASTMNAMNSKRHKFLLLTYVRRHNDMVEKGDTNHLNLYKHLKIGRKRGKKRVSNHCVVKRRK
jgi:hypothetical protein